MEWGNLSWNNEQAQTEEKEPEAKKTKRRKSVAYQNTTKHLYRRAFSESQLFDAVGIELKRGYSYNVMTAGDVDALSYLKLILRHQDLDYCLFSTWVMAAEDILIFEDWLKSGKIKKLDAYLGEVFPGSYAVEYQMLKRVFRENKCGRIAVFRNHSKIFAGYGKKFHFGIQTSANINTNPRAENGCITIDKGIFEFYKSYFDDIECIDRNSE